MSKRLLSLVALCLVLVAPGFSEHAADSDEKLASDFGLGEPYTCNTPTMTCRAWSVHWG
jgi:hypothetical protein